jgi:hypothetical protein
MMRQPANRREIALARVQEVRLSEVATGQGGLSNEPAANLGGRSILTLWERVTGVLHEILAGPKALGDRPRQAMVCPTK